MKVTRIAYSKNLTAGKYAALEEQAIRLGRIRSEVWQRFGSIIGVNLSFREIRDQWVKEGKQFDVPANPWKATLNDAIDDITATRAAAAVEAKKQINRRYPVKKDKSNDAERKRLFTLLKSGKWVQDKYLCRVMRKHWKRGKNHTHNQIIVGGTNYRTFELNGKLWISIPSLIKRKTNKIPLNTTVAPTGRIRVILKGDNKVEIHYYATAPKECRPCGKATIGVDKGYTEALVDSDGEFHGTNLGKLLTTESDYRKLKYQRRSKLKAIAEKKPHKRANIEKNNLGRKKVDARKSKNRMRIRTEIFTAVHAVVDKAAVIVAEDLTAPMANMKQYGKNAARRLSAWTKGVIAEALENVSQRRGASLQLVNYAFTSQVDYRHGIFGIRKGNQLHCFDGVVLHTDIAGAKNCLARLYDSEISRYTPYRKVKEIIQDRTDRFRLGLLNPDSSYTPVEKQDINGERIT